MVDLFKRLCRYYYTLDPAATADYVHSYRGMWDSEGDETWDNNPPRQARKIDTGAGAALLWRHVLEQGGEPLLQPGNGERVGERIESR